MKRVPILLLSLALGACDPNKDDTGIWDADGDGFSPSEGDCDDADDGVFPGAVEVCDGRDQDCDGVPDAPDPADGWTVYEDLDGDGYGDPATGSKLCDPSKDLVTEGGDCDDQDPAVNPGAAERCDGIDDDCDGAVDDFAADAPIWYVDGDSDGFGEPDSAFQACDDPGAGHSDRADDCDDDDASVHPGAPEACDGIDHDCDGQIDGDADGDGHADAGCGGGDCDDGDATVFPGAFEVCGDGRVNDCLGTEDEARAACWGEIFLDDADGTFQGESKRNLAGFSVASIGDSDGDGLCDFAIGAPSAFGDAGVVYVIHGRQGGGWGEMNLVAADARILGVSPADALGISVNGIGDVNGDGFTDLLAGAEGLNSPAYPTGAAFLLHGPFLGDRSAVDADLVLLGQTVGERAGYAVSGAGDVDGDSLPDILVGVGDVAPGGRVYLQPGSTDGEVRGMEAWAVYETASGNLGTTVSGGGDVDGDGLSDLLLADRRMDGANHGGAWLVLAPSPGQVDLAVGAVALVGPIQDIWAGDAVSNTGDLSGDGYDDLVIGGERIEDNKVQVGGAWIVSGRVDIGSSPRIDLGSADAVLVGAIADSEAGHAMDAGGDLDGDGFDDLVIGAPRDQSWNSAGSVYAVLGPLAGRMLLGDAEVALRGVAASDEAGQAVGIVDDADGDGWSEILVGAPSTDIGAGAAYFQSLQAAY